ncbi:MAG: MBL fold metallo-hydrolase [Gammaproteobacteria bacterium]|nr:MBL fold metallo-hydrolase [Gammaproteobacteria bacterium]
MSDAPPAASDDVAALPFDIHCIDTGLFRPRLVASYLVRGGEEYAFIECGASRSVPRLLGALEQLGIDRSQLRYVMPTHVHLDHAGGAGALLAALPQARLVIHPRGARHMIDPRALWQGAAQVYGEAALERHYGALVPVAEQRMLVATDGFEISLGDRRLRCIDTPGHARHHYCVWDAASRGLFSGDTLGMRYRELDTPAGPFLLPTTTPVQFDPPAWHDTLARFAALAPARAFVTHYGMVENVVALIGDLGRRIDAHARIAESFAGAGDRTARIAAALMAATVAELDQLGCDLDAAGRDRVLAWDMQLNAGGLDVWLTTRRARR